MTFNLNGVRVVIGIVILVMALVLGIIGRMPGMEALLFGLCGVGIMVG